MKSCFIEKKIYSICRLHSLTSEWQRLICNFFFPYRHSLPFRRTLRRRCDGEPKRYLRMCRTKALGAYVLVRAGVAGQRTEDMEGRR